MLDRLLDVLLPPRCGGCGRMGEWFCAHCLDRTRRLQEPLCPKCGRELAFRGSYCGCRLVGCDCIRSAVALEGPVEAAMHRFKYLGWRQLARPMSRLMAAQLRAEAVPARLAVAVPLHRKRRRSRGFNQSELLLDELSRLSRLQQPPGRLVKMRETPPQVGLDRLRRMGNLNSIFEWRGEILQREPVIVVDDVSTTGATIDACAQALKAGGAGMVFGLTVARVGS